MIEPRNKDAYILFTTQQDHAVKSVRLNVIPETISHSYSANWQQRDLLGRLSPMFTYSSGSEEVYSFSVELHEDLDAKENLVHLIEDIKALSYPVMGSGGIIKPPVVYFELGEISGEGLVTTTIHWNKPFRKGRYIYATVNFSIVVEDEEKPTELTIVQEHTSGNEVVTVNKYIFDGNTSLYNAVVDSLQNYGATITDFISPADAQGIREVVYGWAAEEYNYAATRLNNLFDLMSASVPADSKNRTFVDEFIAGVRGMTIDLFDSKILSGEDIQTLSDDIHYDKVFAGAITSFLNKINDEIGPLTSEEKEKIKDALLKEIEHVNILAQEVVYYGKSR